MEQFSLEKYLANPSMKVVTRDGRKVKIIYTDAKGDYPIVALIEFFDGTAERADSFTSKGYYYIGEVSNKDLFFEIKKHEGWVNIYKSKYDGYEPSQVYQRKEDAESEKYINDSDAYITTIKIEWEE